MTKRTKIILFIGIVAVALGGILLYNHLTSKRDQSLPAAETAPAPGRGSGRGGARIVPVTVFIADHLRLNEGIRSVGTLLPNEEVDISSEIAGKVERIAFEEGTLVKRGQILVKVNDEDLQAQLRRAVFQRDLLREKLERNRILLSKDAISREAFDQIETDYNMIEADIQLLQVKIDKTEIKAPFDGVIGFRYISLGSYVQPNTQVARLVDYSKLKVEFAVPERYHQFLQTGAYISFTTQGDPSTVHRARIYAIDPTVDQSTRTITMRALYDNGNMKLQPGMFASVVAGERSGDTLQVPTEAIVPEANNMKVWVVRNGKAVSVPVATGTRSENMIEITGGLMRGDSVILTGLLQVREGSPVQVQN